MGYSWPGDGTYGEINGKRKFSCQAIDERGHMIDFNLSSTRDMKIAKRFLVKASRSTEQWVHTQPINTDKAPVFDTTIGELNEEGKLSRDTLHQQVKYFNNIIKADHDKLKQLIKLTFDFKSMKTAYATIKGFELMHMFKKGLMDAWKYGRNLIGEIYFIERQFDIYAV